MANLYRPATTLLVNGSVIYKIIVRITTLQTEKVVKITPDGTNPSGGTLNLFYETSAGASTGIYENEHLFTNPEGGRFTVNTTNTVVATSIAYAKRDTSENAEPVSEF